MSIDLIAWPAQLPTPLRNGHSLSPRSRVVASEMDNGFQRLRPRRINPPDDMPVTWLFDAEQFELFRGWFAHVFNYGAREFSSPVLVGAEVVYLACKFKPGTHPYKAAAAGFNQRVTATLTVRDVPVLAADTTIQRIHDISAQQISDAVDNALTDYTTE